MSRNVASARFIDLWPYRTPEDGAIEAHLDKGVLHVTVKKPSKAVTSAKTIEIKAGAPPQA